MTWLTNAERAERRERYRVEALQRAARVGRSIKCGGWDGIAIPRHADMPDGCRNDGTNCLCECHDTPDRPS